MLGSREAADASSPPFVLALLLFVFILCVRVCRFNLSNALFPPQLKTFSDELITIPFDCRQWERAASEQGWQTAEGKCRFPGTHHNSAQILGFYLVKRCSRQRRFLLKWDYSRRKAFRTLDKTPGEASRPNWTDEIINSLPSFILFYFKKGRKKYPFHSVGRRIWEGLRLHMEGVHEDIWVCAWI